LNFFGDQFSGLKIVRHTSTMCPKSRAKAVAAVRTDLHGFDGFNLAAAAAFYASVGAGLLAAGSRVRRVKTLPNVPS
jgi:hypothetical protein